jgi:translation initiation factor IF-3
LSRPYPSRSFGPAAPQVRINGKIRAREVRVIGVDGQQVGVVSLGDALTMARQHGVDLVEIAPNATPPVCRLVDFGKFRYEQAKREKESKKHQHANKVKEVQLSPNIDPHDFATKLHHAIEFFCDDMKVKVSLRFRGREMAHTEIGFQVINKFIKEVEAFAHPDNEPKLVGRGINVMFSPLPRSKRAKNPYATRATASPPAEAKTQSGDTAPATTAAKGAGKPVKIIGKPEGPTFSNNPFSSLEVRDTPGEAAAS